jgi:hypothetical protein
MAGYAIEPNTDIWILKNVPLDNTYGITLDFGEKSAATFLEKQYEYFQSKVKYTIPENTYTRSERGWLRVPYTPDDLYDCNYIMFRNKNYGNKWFYAFITDEPRYINNNCCEIPFEIDDMQTWFFPKCSLKKSFVIREHSVEDNFGENRVEEGLELGEYYTSSLRSTEQDLVPVVWFSADAETDLSTDSVSYKKWSSGSKVYSGLYYTAFTEANNYHQFLDLVNSGAFATGQGSAGEFTSDNIVSINMAPRVFVHCTDDPDDDYNYKGNEYSYDIIASDQVSKIGTYTPHNKKVLQYPYNFLNAIASDGGNAVIKFENFSDDNTFGVYSFKYVFCNSPTAQAGLLPLKYKSSNRCVPDMLVCKDFPQCAWTSSSYSNWLATTGKQYKNQIFNSTVGVASGVVNALATDPTNVTGSISSINSAVSSAVSSAATTLKYLQAKEVAQEMPKHASGQDGSSIMVQLDKAGFTVYSERITVEFARRIDGYFDMYGYATNRFKVPNINSRPFYNYVKTTDVNITGSIPAKSMSNIKNIFDRGITIWHDTETVADYNVDNTVSSATATAESEE